MSVVRGPWPIVNFRLSIEARRCKLANVNGASRERWAGLWSDAKLDGEALGWYERLVTLYSEKQRAYHTLDHISECLREFDAAKSETRDAIALELAIWFHDAIYKSRASDNEERSAGLAEECLAAAGASGDLVAAVAALVLDTKTHVPSSHPDAALLIDIDLAILGQPEKRFDDYEQQIRKEYFWVPTMIFRPKRAAILRNFLNRPRIYNTATFYGKYERAARANIQRALGRLK